MDLQNLANEMKAEQKATGQPVRKAMDDGLCVAWNGNQLSLSRMGEPPSIEEIRAVQEAFSVASWGYSRVQTPRRGGQSWHIARLRRVTQVELAIELHASKPVTQYY